MSWRETWAGIVEEGTTIDLYVLDTTLDDWDRFLEFLRDSEWEVRAWWLDAPPNALPSARDLVGNHEGRTLVVKAGTMELICNFFDEEEIELWLAPNATPSPEALEPLLRFMTDLGRALEVEVLLCPENARAHPMFLATPEGALVEG